MKQDFFKRQFVANCHCAANKEAIFEYTYNQTFDGEKTGEVDILFLLEFKERDNLNKNFASLVRHTLKDKFKYAIIPGLGCTPKGFSSGDTVNTYSTCKAANIKKRILEYNPKVIVTTGRSLYTITEMKDLKPDHFFSLHKDEKYLYSPEFKCNVVPLPALFTWNSNNAILDVFEFDHTKKQIQLACELAIQPKARIPKLNYIKLEDPNEFIRKIIADESIIDLSVDIETSGLDYYRDELYSIQFAFNETDGHFAFFKDIDKDLLIQLFALKRICFIFQNGQFDVKFLKANGIHNARNDFDTMYASYILNENKPKGLKPNTWIFTKYGGYETKLKKSLNDEEVRKNFTKVPINILLEYACTDAIITYILKKYFEKRLLEEDEDVRNNFYNVMMKATDMIIEVEYTGIQLDRVYLNEYADSMKKEAREIEDEIYKLAGRSFNLNSKKELTKVLEKVPGFKVLKDEEGNELRTKTGDLQLGRDIMDMYAEKGFPLAKKISHYYHIQKELSQIRDAEAEKNKTIKEEFKQKVLFEIDEDLIDVPIEEQDGFLASVYDNRLHGGFDLGGTDTGRMASRGGLRSSVNFQNFTKKEAFRKLFLPIKDHVFIEADYEGMEVGQASQISGTGPLEENLLLGKDMHSFLASQMMKALGKINPQTGKFYTYEEIFQYAKIDEIPEFVKIRGQGKSTIFSCLYGSTEFGLQSNLGVDIETAKLFLQVFYETYPEFKKYMDDFRTQAKKVGWVKTLTGKKRRFPELTYIGRDGNNKDRRKRMNSMMNGVINAPIQGSSGQTCLLAMCSIREEFRKRDFRSRVLSNVHDSILVETYVPELDEVVEILKECMSRKYYENRLGSKVKLKAEIKYGEIWGFGKKHEYWKKNPDEFKQMVERINLRNEKLWTRYPNAA